MYEEELTCIIASQNIHLKLINSIEKLIQDEYTQNTSNNININ